MFALPRTGRLGANAQRARAALPVLLLQGFGGSPKFSPTWNVRPPTIANRGRSFGFTLPKQRERASAPRPAVALREGGFTLIELLIVIGIIAVLLVLIAPAFTTIKGGTDVTSAAYTIKGVLDTARTYAKANNTYAWVGFYEENVANPASPNTDSPAVGRVIASVVASIDGTTVYNLSNPSTMDPAKLISVTKLAKIENAHLWTHTDTPSGTGSTFDTRPNITLAYCIGDASPTNSNTPFQYPVGQGNPSPQYTFQKVIQFSPRGEARINNDSNSPQVAIEIALEQTHGVATPAPEPANLVAIQISGFSGNVNIFRR